MFKLLWFGGQSSAFPIDFAGRPYRVSVMTVVVQYRVLHTTQLIVGQVRILSK